MQATASIYDYLPGAREAIAAEAREKRMQQQGSQWDYLFDAINGNHDARTSAVPVPEPRKRTIKEWFIEDIWGKALEEVCGNG